MFVRLKNYAVLMRLNKPIGIFLLLWPTLWALWIAGEGHPDKLVIAIFVVGVVLMRSAGCVINDFADRDIDPEVARTQTRPIASGLVSPGEALVLFVLLSLAAFSLVWLTNTLTIYLSVVGALLAAVYPFLAPYLFAAGVFRLDLWLGDSNGVRGANQCLAKNCLVVTYREYAVGNGLRHHVRDGRSRR